MKWEADKAKDVQEQAVPPTAAPSPGYAADMRASIAPLALQCCLMCQCCVFMPMQMLCTPVLGMHRVLMHWDTACGMSLHLLL